jgi:hypothetical protein
MTRQLLVVSYLGGPLTFQREAGLPFQIVEDLALGELAYAEIADTAGISRPSNSSQAVIMPRSCVAGMRSRVR